MASGDVVTGEIVTTAANGTANYRPASGVEVVILFTRFAITSGTPTGTAYLRNGSTDFLLFHSANAYEDTQPSGTTINFSGTPAGYQQTMLTRLPLNNSTYLRLVQSNATGTIRLLYVGYETK